MKTAITVILITGLVAFICWQVYGLVKDIIAKQKLKKEKSSEEQTEVKENTK